MKCLQVCFLSSAYQQNFFVQYENELLLCSCFENDGQLKKKKDWDSRILSTKHYWQHYAY